MLHESAFCFWDAVIENLSGLRPIGGGLRPKMGRSQYVKISPGLLYRGKGTWYFAKCLRCIGAATLPDIWCGDERLLHENGVNKVAGTIFLDARRGDRPSPCRLFLRAGTVGRHPPPPRV